MQNHIERLIILIPVSKSSGFQKWIPFMRGSHRVCMCLFIEVAILKKVCKKVGIEFRGMERLWRPSGN